MTSATHDKGVLQALADRFNNQRLPRILELKTRVDAGESLTDRDMQFLKRVFRDAESVQPLIERNPEYQELVTRIVRLYKEITDKALENENQA